MSAKTACVKDAMTTDLHTIDGLATIAEAIQAMRQHGVSSLVVDRRDANDEVGLLEVTGIAATVVSQNRAKDRVNVYEAMTKPVVTVPTGMLARYAVRLLCQLGLSRAVVVNDQRDAVGMVTLRDLVLGDAS